MAEELKPATDADGYYLPSTLTDDMLHVYLRRVYGPGVISNPGVLANARRDYRRIYESRYTISTAKNELDKLTALFIALRFRKAAS